MRSGFLAIAVLMVAACDQVAFIEPDATWTGSIGRLVADGKNPDRLEFIHRDGAGPEQGRMSVIPTEELAAGEAARIETLGQPPRMESLQARLVTERDIDADATCWLRFDGRAVQPQVELGLGRLSIAVRPRTSDGEALLDQSIYLDPQWTPIDLKFSVPNDLPAGEAEIVFGVGTQLQVLDIASVAMRCFEDARALARMPETSFSYAGRGPEAPWRATAQSHIERYRKGDLAIEVKDAEGRPVADAEIHIRMSRHAFAFGAMIDPSQLAGVVNGKGSQEKTASYREDLKDLFNTVAFDDALRWTNWTDPDKRPVTEEALAWVQSLGLDLRGHGLISARTSDLPPALDQERDAPDVIRRAVRDGVTETASDLAGRIMAWDVVDKPRDNHDLLDLVGWDELAAWFRLADAAAPDAELVLNESEILAGDRMAELATLIGELVGDGVPIDGLGVEGRFGAQPPPIQVLSDRFDQLASFDLPLVITAFDMQTADRPLQQDFARDFLTLAFSHPSVEGFVFGRFWQEAPSDGGVAMFQSDGAISPIGNIYRDLVLGRWWTDLVALSNAEGELTSRVFQGDYMISARKDDLVASTLLTLGAEGGKVTLTLAADTSSDRTL